MEKRAASAEIVTRTERLWLEDGVVHCVVLPTPTHTLVDAHENAEAFRVVAGGRRAPLLLDARDSRGLDRDARLYYARPEAARDCYVLAMLIDSQISRILANFYMNVNPPPFPMRLFLAEAEAVAWLKAQGS